MKYPLASGSRSAFASLALVAPLAAQQPPEPAPASVPVVYTPLPPGQGMQWRFGDMSVKLGGYVKVDLIHDFDPIDSTSSFDPRTIPTDSSDGTNTKMQANTSRLNLDVRDASPGAELRVFLEGDFYGSGNGFRLRHAYGVVGPVLGGQTWTNFMDADGMPETLDFESPIGFPLIRQAQARYTNELASGNSYSFSIEDPASAIAGVDTTTGHVEEQMPDLTANYIWNHSRGHLQVSGFAGAASYNPDVGADDSVPLWGVNLSTLIDTWGEDKAILQFTYGDGVGRYRGGVTAAPDASGELEAITTTAVLASYQHYWSDKYRSTICYSWADGDLPAGTPPEASETLQYFAANLIWQFSARAWTGVECLYGTNDAFDGSEGDATRVQFSLRFNL